MAKTKKVEQVKPRVSFPIVIQPRDNSRQTLPGWRTARDSAESIYMPQRKPLIDLYREITLDPHLSNEMGKRIRGVTNVSWAFLNNGDPVPEVEALLKKRAFKKILRHIIEARMYGFSLIELLDLRKGKVELVPREYVLPELNLVVLDPTLTSEGYDYTTPPFVNRVLPVGEPEDLGLLFNVAPYVILKKGDVSDWATYCEVFGSPLRIGKYDPAIPGQDTIVSNQLKNMGNNAWGAFPVGTEFEFIESAKGGTGNTVYDSFADFCNAEISKGIVGQTMTSQDGSSEAQAKIHKEILEEINRDDREYVMSVLNEDFIPLLEAAGYNIPSGAEFTVMEEESTIPKSERLEMDLKIHREVKPIEATYFEEEYNVTFAADAPEPSPAVVQPQVVKPKSVAPQSVQLSDTEQLIQALYPAYEPTLIQQAINVFSDILPERRNLISSILFDMYNSLYRSLTDLTQQKEHILSYPAFKENVTKLLDAVDKGFSTVRYGQPNFELLQNLRQSVVFFAASKTFLQASELSDLLIAQDGSIRQFADFSKMAEPILNNYNRNWLKTEYDLAVRAARAAKDFKQAEDTKDVYPNLKYLPSIAVSPRDEHKKFYGTVLPVDHPFWNTHLPPSDYNCKCSFEPTNEPASGDAPADLPVPAEPVITNPARTGRIFNEQHPYFQKVGILDDTQNRLIEDALLRVIQESKASSIVNADISNGVISMNISSEGFRDIIGKPHAQQIKKLLLINDLKSFREAFRSSTYAGDQDGKSYYAFDLGTVQNYFVMSGDNYLLDITETF